MSTPAVDSAAPATAASAAASPAIAGVAPAAAAAAVPAPAPLSGTDKLTLMMIEKSLSTLGNHPAIQARGPLMLQRNLYGILFGSVFSQSWENQLVRDEQRSSKLSQQKLNEASLKRVEFFFKNKKHRTTSGAALALALLNQSCKGESFEHRWTLIWIGGRVFKIDGMKRDGQWRGVGNKWSGETMH